MRILITGASGFIGTSLLKRFTKNGNEILGTYHTNESNGLTSLDITDRQSVFELARNFSPELIIHCAAMGRPDDCERNPKLAEEINVNGTKNVVDASHEINATVAFISSIYVFDGRKGSPYNETDVPTPLSVYGRTKAEAENLVRTQTHNIILRTDMVYGYNGEGNRNGLVGAILTSQSSLYLDNNSLRQPTFLDDIEPALTTILNHDIYGTFHLGGKDRITQLDLGRRIEKLIRDHSIIQERVTDTNLVIAPRPQDLIIDTSKASHLGIRFTNLEGSIRTIGERLATNRSIERASSSQNKET